MSLSSLIVQREVASIRQVEEALARQVLYGGDLVTNLMEVVQVPEVVLLPLMAEAVGLASAPLGMLPAPTPQARALVPEDVAAKRVVMPLAVEGDRLVLAVSEPMARDDLEELSFALGVRIEERIAPSVRIREALARVYGVPLERRMARLVGRLAGVDPTVPNSLPPVAGPKASVPPLPGALVHDIPRLNPPGMPVMGSLRFPEPHRVEERKPELARPSSSADLKAVLPTLLRDSKAPPPVARRRGPVTLEMVTAELPETKDREALLSLFFDFARQFFEYSAIFVVHGDLAEGRDAFGNGASRDRLLAVGVPLDMPSMLRTARDRGVPLTATAEHGGIDSVLMSDLRRDPRSKVLVVPIVVRTRVVAFFVADDGAQGIDPASQGEVVAVAGLVGREFERLIVRMKLGGFSGDSASRPSPVDPRRVAAKPRRTGPDRDTAIQALEQAVTGRTPPLPPPPPPPPPPSPPAKSPSAAPPSWPPKNLRRASTQPAPVPSDEPRPAPLRGHNTLRNFLVPVGEEDDDAETERAPEPFPLRRPIDRTLVGGFDAIADAAPKALEGELAPPPPQAAAVRHPSGQPIPREETDEDGAPISSTRFEAVISSRPPPADLRQARLLRDIDALTEKLGGSPASQRPRSSAPSSRLGQSMSVPPHRPPPSSRFEDPLPSVIVDDSREIERLLDTYLESPNHEQAISELLRLGQQAMPTIMKRFPGPLTITRATLDDSWPRVSECGPILRLIAGQRKVALPFVLARTDDPDTESRFWATYLLTELAYVEAIPSVVARIFDDSKRVRRAARLVAHILGEIAGASLITELDRIVRDPRASSARRVVTVETLGEMRDPLVVPVLLNTLGDEDEEVAMAVRKALLVVTRQDFGLDAKKWVAWWHANAMRHRIEWLIDALSHEATALRRAAGQELKGITEQYFGYYDDLPKKDREKAQKKYRDWWRDEGMARFKKA